MQNLKHLLADRAECLASEAMSNPDPIWRLLTTRELSKVLGVSVQVLANWRVRDLGPPYRHARPREGHKCFYRMDEVLQWLTGRPAWEFSRSWLAHRGLAPADAEQDYVEWAEGCFG
ncbi:helix-turn-helix transcriptional regulator [Salipiger sp.]|uniref:helix-turn-helix transcriptional regulator n=1 Tax=Salipiger sp. TaxID=2078585 RepID=UPI003A985A23